MSEDLNVRTVITVEDSGATANLGKVEKGVQAVDKAIDAAGTRARTAKGQFAGLDATVDGLGASSTATAGRLALLGRSLDSNLVKAKRFGDAYRTALDARTSTRADLLGLGLIAAGGASVWATARYQKETSALKAFSHASQAEMAAMDAAAMRTALATDALGFKAGEAVQAQVELAKAGVSTGDIIGGGLAGSLALAATEGIAVGDAATYMSDTLNTFGLRGREAVRVADTLAAGSAASSTSVAGLAESLGQAGLVANQTNLSLEDTVGTLAAFAQNGLKGSDAGTSLRTMLLRLNPVSVEAANLIDQYGLSAYDAKGQFIGLAAFAGKLQTGLRDLTTEQRNQVLQTVYGQDAIRAAAIVYELGAAGVDKWTESVSKSGEAERMAREQTDNLAGDLDKLKAVIDGTLIKSGSGGNDALRSMTQEATTLVRGVSALPGPILQGGVAITVLTGAAVLAVPRIAAMKTALAELKVTGAGAASTLKRVGVGVGVTVGVTVLTQMALDGAASLAVLDDNLDTVKRLRAELATPTDSTMLSSTVAELQKTGVELAKTGRGYSTFMGQLNLGWQQVAAWMSGEDMAAKMVDQALAIRSSEKLSATYTAALGDLAFKMGTTGGAATDLLDKYVASGHAVNLLNGNYHDIADSVVAWTKDTYAGATATNTATAAVDNQSAAIQRQALVLAAANGWVDHQKAIIGYQAALDAATAAGKKNGDTLSVHSEKGRANRNALLAIADAAKAAWTQTDKDGVVTVTNAGRYRAATAEIVAQALAMGKSKDEAQLLAKRMMGVNTELDKTGRKKPKPTTQLQQTAAGTGARIDITSKLSIIEQHLAALDGTTARVGVSFSLTGSRGLPGLPSTPAFPGVTPIGDTSNSKAHGSPGSLARTLGAHARLSAGMPGMRISNTLTGGGGWGYGSGDHQEGRALDVVGPSLGEYVRRVRAAGGFAEIHGAGPGRHAHSVPMGDTTSSRARTSAASGTTHINVPVTVVGEVTADQVTGLTSRIRGVVEDWQRSAVRRGTG